MSRVFKWFNRQKEFEKAVENGETANVKFTSFYADALKRLKKDKVSMVCFGVIVVLVLIAIFAPVIAPYSPTAQDYAAVLQPPTKAHLLGTDEFGRDILSRIIYGSRVSLSIGIIAQIMQTEKQAFSLLKDQETLNWITEEQLNSLLDSVIASIVAEAQQQIGTVVEY